MKLSIGIVGLPNVGKSTLFKALTKQEVKIANYPFVTIDPNVGVVGIPDERLEKVAKVIGSKEIFPAVFEFVDIAGLVKGAHQGAGLGNQFLSHIREVDAIIHLVRIFKNTEIVHFENELNPLRDFETVLEELKLKDEQSKEKENLLSKKPQLIILNGKPEEVPQDLINKIIELKFPYLILDLKDITIETALPLMEVAAQWLSDILNVFLKLLDLVVFYTANENEARSWLVKKGTKVPRAAGVVHTDFEKKFIKAEAINWQKLLEARSASSGQAAWQTAKQKGLIRLEGKDYAVEDGDVIVIRHG
jgi:small GTP-binding protein